MLQRLKNFHYTKTLLISVIAISLAACSTGTDVTNTPTDSASSAPSLASSSSPETTSSSSNIAIPGVNNVSEISFKAPSGNSINGYFDTVNGATATTSVEVSKAAPLTTKGWAFLANESRPADSVLITYGNNNSLVAVAPINLERSDVAKFLKNPAYKNSGWSTTFNPSGLPTGKVVLKAWAYNSTSKEATQLNPIHEVTLID